MSLLRSEEAVRVREDLENIIAKLSKVWGKEKIEGRVGERASERRGKWENRRKGEW
jgi:hypothetical protein